MSPFDQIAADIHPFKLYRVSWDIEVMANDAEHAAQIALDIQRDKFSDATVFDVQECIDEDPTNLGDAVMIDLADYKG